MVKTYSICFCLTQHLCSLQVIRCYGAGLELQLQQGSFVSGTKCVSSGGALFHVGNVANCGYVTQLIIGSRLQK
jgi:hypothetical protein